MITYYIITLFPDFIVDCFGHSILKRAVSNNIIDYKIIDIRKFSRNKTGHIDDYIYGGGAGMLIKPEPIYDAYASLKLDRPHKVIYPNPVGEVFTQKKSIDLANFEDIVFICGHYEGIDERVIEEIVTDRLSIGDYVISGGELSTMVMIDSISRNVKGVLGNNSSTEEESFSNGLLEYAQYTKPREFMGRKVPDVLLSGHHKKIEEYRMNDSIERTKKYRPDLYDKIINKK